MSGPPADFHALVARARQGDGCALTELVQQYEDDVRIVARVLLGPALRPHLDSVDLVQSVHRAVLLGLRQDKFDLSSPGHLLRLALTLVRRKVARHWRRERRQHPIDWRAVEAAGDLAGLIASLGNPDPDPARTAQYRDQVEHLLQNLDENERRLVGLRLQGCTTPELAEALGAKPGAVRARLSRLRQHLRDCGLLTDWL